MNATTQPVNPKKNPVLVMDMCVAFSLLLAIVAVLCLDRRGPEIVDLVFILDQRVEMRDETSQMKADCVAKLEGLKASGADCRSAVIPFGTKRYRIPTVGLTADLDEFKKQLLVPRAQDAAEPAASAAAALEQALNLPFRKNAQVLFFLISKSPCQNAGEMTTVARRMQDRGITTIVRADATQKDRCQPLYKNGRFYSMDGKDLTDPALATGQGGIGRSRKSSLLTQLSADKQTSALLDFSSPYRLRTVRNLDAIIARGGSAESEAAVQSGLEWLARHQASEGYWSDSNKCEHDSPPCHSLTHGAPIAETGLAVLAFQAGGNYYFNDNEYSANVKRGLDWLLTKQQSDGRLFGNVATWYEHGIATFALAEACAVSLASKQTPDARYLAAAQRAVAFIENHQYPLGGWQYQERQEIGDTSVTGWQVLALKSAKLANIAIKPETFERVGKFYEATGDPKTGRTGYQSRYDRTTELTTAVGLLVQVFIMNEPNEPKSELATNAIRYFMSLPRIGQSGDFYALYNATLAMFLAHCEEGKNRDEWIEWNRGVRDAIVQRQDKTGCARGSWCQSNSPWSTKRTLDTAWAVLTLEVYYRYSTKSESDPTRIQK